MSLEDAVPGVLEAKEAFAVAKVLWPLLALIGGAGAVGAAWLYVEHLRHAAQAAQQKAAVAGAQTVVAQGQTQAQSDATKVVVAGQAKDDITLHIQQDNAHAIETAPGAAQGVDPGLYGALVGGMCRYAATSGDPRCGPVPAADPAVVQPAGGVGSAARPNGR